jgi:hypothetical protein
LRPIGPAGVSDPSGSQVAAVQVPAAVVVALTLAVLTVNPIGIVISARFATLTDPGLLVITTVYVRVDDGGAAVGVELAA